MPTAVFLDLDTVSRDDLDLSELNQTPYEWNCYEQTLPEQILQRIANAELVISNKVVLSGEILEQCPSLKLICIAATGTNNVDLEAAEKLGITVTNVIGYATPAVVQHVFAMILSLTTKLPSYQQAVANGDWQRSPQFCLLDYPIREIAGKTLGIVGYGELGRAVAQVAEAFGMKVLISQRPGGPVDDERLPLHDLLPQVDILSLHCPLTDNTRNLIGHKAIALMKHDALLINTARGGIVDEVALKEALISGRLGGAGIDVLSKEPPVDGNPLLDPTIPNLIITPHTAWASREARQRLINEVAANIQAFLRGEVRNVVSV